MKIAVLITLLFIILFSGCIKEKEQKPSNLSTPEPEITLEKIPPTQGIHENSTAVVELAKKDLAAKLKIPETSIRVQKVIPTEWPDTSLGYPDPGVVYAQVITPGYVILLQADNNIYEYHSDYERIVPPPDLKSPSG